MRKRIICLSFIFSSLIISANANEVETVNIKVCIDTTKNTDKSFKQLKEMLKHMAQNEAFNTLYKQIVYKENKTVLSVQHREDLNVKVEDMSDEGNNLCSINTVSIEKERLKYYLPQEVSRERICYKDESLSLVKLKEVASLKSYKALIAKVTDKKITDELAKTLIHNYQRDDGKLYMSKGAYCFGASGEVIPFEIEMGILSEKKKTEERKRLSQSRKQLNHKKTTSSHKKRNQKIGIVRGLDPYGDGFLSLRTKPGGHEINRLYNYEKVFILGKRGSWYKVKKINSGQIGWSHGKWISVQ